MTATTITRVLMPRLSDSMEEGVIVQWLIADGDEVAVGQEIVEVETDKATMPYEAESAGKIHVRAAEGDTVAVGAVIAVIGDDDGAEPMAEAAGALPPAASDADTQAAPRPGREAIGAAGAGHRPTASATGEGGPRRVDASPVARRIALELGVDLAAVSGTGPGGRVVKADVRGASVSTAPRSAAPARVPRERAVASDPARGVAESTKGTLTVREPTRLQQVIARRMAESKAIAPDFVLKTDVDMEAAVALRAQLRTVIGPETKLPSYNDFVIKACALALRETPLANGSYADGHFELHSRVNIGVAVAATGALVVPTIFDADQKSLGEIGRSSRELAQKVRDGRITPPELSGGTFSVSNLGMFGVDEFTAVINPPQAAILAVGSLKQRAVVYDGELAARHTMTISLSCDHRILYGAEAAEFLAHIRRLLEAPGTLVL